MKNELKVAETECSGLAIAISSIAKPALTLLNGPPWKNKVMVFCRGWGPPDGAAAANELLALTSPRVTQAEG